MTPPAHEEIAGPARFDRLAHFYRALEFLAFGGDLERTRFLHLEHLAGCARILVLGEGDGRCLARLVRLAPSATLHCVDASPAMLATASKRLPPEARERVTFTCADALACSFDAGPYDAVVTLFFLDCFTAAQVAGLVNRLSRRLTAEGRWLWADFVVPRRGWARLRARLWLSLLYTFFRWGTGLRVSSLPPSEEILEQTGFRPIASATLQHGLLRTTLYGRPARQSVASSGAARASQA